MHVESRLTISQSQLVTRHLLRHWNGLFHCNSVKCMFHLGTVCINVWNVLKYPFTISPTLSSSLMANFWQPQSLVCKYDLMLDFQLSDLKCIPLNLKHGIINQLNSSNSSTMWPDQSDVWLNASIGW